jgi:hypothetical protein
MRRRKFIAGSAQRGGIVTASFCRADFPCRADRWMSSFLAQVRPRSGQRPFHPLWRHWRFTEAFASQGARATGAAPRPLPVQLLKWSAVRSSCAPRRRCGREGTPAVRELTNPRKPRKIAIRVGGVHGLSANNASRASWPSCIGLGICRSRHLLPIGVRPDTPAGSATSPSASQQAAAGRRTCAGVRMSSDPGKEGPLFRGQAFR